MANELLLFSCNYNIYLVLLYSLQDLYVCLWNHLNKVTKLGTGHFTCVANAATLHYSHFKPHNKTDKQTFTYSPSTHIKVC